MIKRRGIGRSGEGVREVGVVLQGVRGFVGRGIRGGRGGSTRCNVLNMEQTVGYSLMTGRHFFLLMNGYFSQV